MITINVLVDSSRSFVDSDGSFYCGTTEKQKDKAVEINKDSDIIIYLTDVHSIDSSEFQTNGGLFPVHHLIKKDQKELMGITSIRVSLRMEHG